MMFDQPSSGVFPSEIAPIIKKFVQDCANYRSGFSNQDENSCGASAYFVCQVQKKSESGEPPQWVKVAKTDGQPMDTTIATMMFARPTGRYRLVWYAFGGSTQGKGGRIIRSELIEWTNEDPDSGAIDLVEQVPTVKADTGVILQTLLARSEAARQAEHADLMRWIAEREKVADERSEKLLDRVLGTVDRFADFSLDMMDMARNTHTEAVNIRSRAFRMETDAMHAERRAVLKEENARQLLQDAEAALEEGKTQGWQGLIQSMMTTEAGQSMFIKLGERVLSVIDTKLLGSANEALRKMGMQDLGAIMAEMNLTPEQMAKAGEIIQRHANKKS